MMIDWWREGFIWAHELVIVHGKPPARVAPILSKEISKFNETASAAAQRKLISVDVFTSHFREHVPESWNLVHRMGRELVKSGEITIDAGEQPPDVREKLVEMQSKADTELFDTIGRMGSVIGKLEARFHQLDARFDAELPLEAVNPYRQLAESVAKGLEALIRFRNQDKALQTILIQFAEQFSIGAMTDAVDQVDRLVLDLEKAGHKEAATMVAVRVRDMFVKVLSGNSRKALDTVRATLKTG